MVKSHKIKLFQEDGWEDGYKEYFENLCLENIINELCGSLHNAPFNLDIKSYKKNLFIANDSPGLSNDDIKRLDTFASGDISGNKNGDSERGAGTRCAFRACSVDEIPDIDITDEFVNNKIINNYSFLISKVSEDIDLKDYGISLKNGDFLLYCYDKGNKYFFYKVTGMNILKQFESCFEQMNILFICPYIDIKKLENNDIKYKLRRIFNRCECNILLNDKNITEDKRYKLFDKGISLNIKYIELKLTIYTRRNKIGKISIIDSSNVDIDQALIYNFSAATQSQLLKYDNDSWISNDKIDEGEKGEYECTIRLQGMNSLIDNKDYFTYYYGKPKISGEINGILPYIDNKCLRYDFPNKKMNNNNMRRWMEGICADRPITRNYSKIVNDTKTVYINGQYWQSEIQENHCDKKEESLFKKTIEKCNSEIKCDNECKKEYHKKIPFFVNYLNKKYIWGILETENIAQNNIMEKKLKVAEEAKKKAEVKTKQALYKAKLEEEARKKAEEKAKQEEEARKKAEEKAKQEEEAKKQAFDEAYQAEEEKIQALEEKTQALDEAAKAKEIINEKDELLINNNITDNIEDGYHIYGMFDPSRPYHRKTGRTTKSKNDLIKQYNARNYPDEVEIIAYIDFENEKGMNSAERHLQNTIIAEHRKYRGDYGTEWLKFPEDKGLTKETMDDYVISGVRLCAAQPHLKIK